MKEKWAWLIGSVIENAWNIALTAGLGSAWLFLAPVLKRIMLVAWNSPQTPIPLSAGWARISLAASTAIAITTIGLLRVAWRRGKELTELRAHKCPETPAIVGFQSYIGPKFSYDGVEWIPILRSNGIVADAKIIISNPQCPECATPLMFWGDWKGNCPNESCKKTYQLSKPLESIKEMARLSAVGSAARGALVFQGAPGFKPLKQENKSTTRRKLPNGLRYDVSKDGRKDPAYCPDEKCDTRVTLPTPGGYGVRRDEQPIWTCPGCDKFGQYIAP